MNKIRTAVLALVLVLPLTPAAAGAQVDAPRERAERPTSTEPTQSDAPIESAAVTTHTVTTTADVVAGGAPISLREAFDLANTDGTDSVIALEPGETYSLTLCGAEDDTNVGGDLDHTATGSLTIVGGEVTFIQPMAAIQTDCSERVIHSTMLGAAVILQGVNIQDGDTATIGGGLLAEGPVTIRDSILAGNNADQYGGAIYSNTGVTLERSIIANNTAGGEGAGGVDADANPVTATSTLFLDNEGGVGAAIFGSDVVLHSSTVLANESLEALAGDIDALTLEATASFLGFSASGQVCSLDDLSVSGGYNFVTDNSCGLTGPTDTLDTTTPDSEVWEFILPVPGGPLHDKVPPAKCAALDLVKQDRPQGARCEIGSTEVPFFSPPSINRSTTVLAPVVVDDVFSGTGDDSLFDIGDLLPLEVASPPTKGTVVFDDFAFTYTPDGSDDGVDEFSLRVCEDTQTECALIPVKITIDGLSSRFFFTNVLRGGPASAEITFGKGAGDEFFVGDFDGDGVDDLAKRANGSNVFTIRDLDGVATAADTTVGYGRPGDQVFVGDWDGNGTDTFAVRRGNQFFVKNSISPGPADVVIGYGKAVDEVFVGDWDADGDDTIAVRRGNVFFVRNTVTTGPADNMFGYGRAADVVLVGDWDANGSDTFAVRRGNLIFVRNDFLTAPAEFSFGFGRATDALFPGDWNNDRLDTFAVRRIVN